MTAFEGNTNMFDVIAKFAIILIVSEFGVLPEIAKAIEELDWT